MALSNLLQEKRKAAQAELDQLVSVDAADFTPEAEARATELSSTVIKDLDERYAAAVADEEKRALADAAHADTAASVDPDTTARKAGGFVVKKEERTYSKDRQLTDGDRFTSYFSDVYGYGTGDLNSRSRLERHGREVTVEGEISKRATNTASFAGLVVPQYLVEEAALIARAGRPTANIVRRMQLPDQGMTLIVPRGTTGAATAIQATENSSVQSTDEVWANVSVPVVTIAGQQDVSRQSLERGTPGIDSLIYADLAGAYAANLDSQVLSGSGSSGQMLGITNTAGVNQATAFGAAATVITFYTKVAGQLNAVETTRFMAPTAIVMHPRRWFWLVSQLDSSNRPLVVPNSQGPFNAYGLIAGQGGHADANSADTSGILISLPVITDANVPTAVGTGPEDQVLVLRTPDLILWENGDGMPQQLRFEQTLGNQLTVKLVAYNYAAFTAGRYPAAVGIVGGNAGSAGFGLAAPTF